MATTITDLKNEAKAAYVARDFERAEKCYREAFELDKNDLLILNNIAAVRIENGDLEGALQATDEALERRFEIQPPFEVIAKIFNRRATAYLKMKEYDLAIEAFKKSLAEVNDRRTRTSLREAEREKVKYEHEQYLSPQLADEARIRGNEHFKNKDFANAKLEYDEAIKRNPSDAKLYSNRAAAYTNLFEYPSALKDCDKAIELDGSFIKAYSRKGMCHMRLKEFHKALEAYKTGLELDPHNEELKKGYAAVKAQISSNMSEQPDEEQISRAMQDEEIQKILADPKLSMIFRQMNENPEKAAQYLRDPQIAGAFEKLVAAGLVKTG